MAIAAMPRIRGVSESLNRKVWPNKPVQVSSESTRDFLYVEDLVEAITLVLDKGPGGEVFQIASGRETSVNERVATIREAIPESRFEVKHEPARRGEIRRNFSDVSKAQKLLGYTPRTDLRSRLKKTWEWFRANSNTVLVMSGQRSGC